MIGWGGVAAATGWSQRSDRAAATAPPSLQARFFKQLERAPERRALGFMDLGGAMRWRTFEELYRRASGYGARLADLGLRRGDVCILVLPSDERCATLLVAVLLLGAVPLLVAPPNLRGAQSNLLEVLKRVMRKTRAKLVLLSEPLGDARPVLGRRGPRFVDLDERLEPDSSAAPLPAVLPDGGAATAALQLTSGTTGFPRICSWRHDRVLAALDGMECAMGLGPEDACLNWTPLYHDMGLVNNFLLCLTAGVPLALLSPTDFIRRPALWLRGLETARATVTWSPNFGFAIAAQRIQDHEIEGVRLDHVRAFWNAAERIHHETLLLFHERFAPYGLRREALKTNFGCAENVGGATFSLDGPYVIERADAQLLHEHGVARPLGDGASGRRSVTVVGVGRPNPGTRLRILSPRRRVLPDGRVGEIALDTPSRMSGYLGDARQTRRAFHGELLLTGDLGYLRNGELFWVGRVHEQLNLRGRKLDPSDFERPLLAVGGLREGCFAAFGVDDGRRGTQRVVVVSELREPVERPCTEIGQEICDRVREQLGVSVDEVILVPRGTLGKTSSGKRRHRHFRQLYLSGELQSSAVWLEREPR